MILNSEVVKNVTNNDKRLLVRVMNFTTGLRQFIEQLPHAENLVFECHSICRGLAQAIPEVKYIDGDYIGLNKLPGDKLRFDLCGASHTWLCTPDDAIIDPYPLGYMAINPVLIPTKGYYANFAGTAYIPNPEVTAQISNPKMRRKSQVFYEIIMASSKQS